LNKTKPLKWSSISGAFSLCPGIAGKPAPTVGASVLAVPEPSPWPLSVGASLLAMAALQPRGPCGQSDKARPELAPPVPVGASLLAMATLRSAKQPRDPCGQSDKARPEPAPLICRSQLAGDGSAAIRQATPWPLRSIRQSPT